MSSKWGFYVVKYRSHIHVLVQVYAVELNIF